MAGMKTVGIIGFGSFGMFLAEKLDLYCRVIGYSRSGKAGKWSASLEEVAKADYLILAIPLDAYEKTLDSLKPIIGQETVIVDVCSVKLEPIKRIRKLLPAQKIISTHPLFGPESASRSLAGHTIVVCKEQSDSNCFDSVRQFCVLLDLNVVEMSADKHDRAMATVHGLTFFIAHSLKDMGLHSQELATPSYKKLLSLAELEQHHSLELFKTIQEGNPYAEQIRNSFTDEVNRLSVTVAAGSEVGDDLLGQPRKKIDEIDRRLVALLALRSRVVSEVADIKQQNGIMVHQEARYTNLKDRLHEMAAKQGVDSGMVSEIWDIIHTYSKRQQADADVQKQ